MTQKLDADLNIIQRSGIEIRIDPITRDMNIIQKLDDEPNDVGGLTAAQLKAKFDEGGNAIKSYINDSLIPQVLGDGLTEANRQTAETARQTAETARQKAETDRQTEERGRADAEAARRDAEAARKTAETARKTAFESAQAEQAAAFQADQTRRQTAFDGEQASRETAFTASQQSREERFESAETDRNLWEDYDSGKEYFPGNKVYYLGSSYVNRAACAAVPPTDETHWQMIAKKGADGADSLSQEAADLRYLQLGGGDMTGPMTVQAPTAAMHPATKAYADAGVRSFKGRTGAVTPQSGDYTAAQVGAYTQAQCISAATRTLLGLGSAATPDQALAALKTSLNAFPAVSQISTVETGSVNVTTTKMSIQLSGKHKAGIFFSAPYGTINQYSSLKIGLISGTNVGFVSSGPSGSYVYKSSASFSSSTKQLTVTFEEYNPNERFYFIEFTTK